MKIDYDELAKILDTFLESPQAFITLNDLGFFTTSDEQEEKLVFHLLLLIENGFISDRQLRTGNPEYIGLYFSISGVSGGAIPIRLTKDGHDFASALHQKPILEKLKKEFTDAPFDMVKDISKSLLTKFIKNRLDVE